MDSLGASITKPIRYLRWRFWRRWRPRVNQNNRRRLTNHSPTVLASNCIGGVMLSDLGLPFLTPTINVSIPAKDFLRFVGDLDRYLSAAEEMVEAEIGMHPYPVGRLIDVDIHFVHYPTFADAKEKWEERCRRVQFDNMVVMMTDRDGCTPEDVARFDRLPYAHKVIFTHRPYAEESAFYIPGFESEKCVGHLFGPSNLWGRRYLDAFDYVSLLNRAHQRTDGSESLAMNAGASSD